MTAADVISGDKRWSVEQGDCIEWLNQLPADSVDLVFGSPPYEQARLYLENGTNLGVSRKTDAWVAWMVEVWRAAERVCKGLVAFVVAGQTRNYKWSAGPALLAAELHRAGFNLRNPPIFSRVGIPGSGGPDWLRADYEWIICTARPGKLPWSDNTECGHAPKWAPGGEMAHRLRDGQRVNQWGPVGSKKGGGGRKPNGEYKPSKLRGDGYPSHKFMTMTSRGANGERKIAKGRITRGHTNGDTTAADAYDPPVLANPGNIIHCNVGGGVMGHNLAHENEAPFPESLVSFFVRSFCPPGGLVCDPFSGSGTTVSVAVQEGRRGIGCDLRESQVKLAQRRISGVTPPLFA